MARTFFHKGQELEAFDYLMSKGLSYAPRSKDPIEQRKYLLRIANKARREEEAGRSTPTRAELRGHERIDFLPARDPFYGKDKKGKSHYYPGRPAQVRAGSMSRPITRKGGQLLVSRMDREDVKAHRPKRGPNTILRVIICGIPDIYLQAWEEDRSRVFCYSYRLAQAILETLLSEEGRTMEDIAEEISDNGWHKVYSFSIILS